MHFAHSSRRYFLVVVLVVFSIVLVISSTTQKSQSATGTNCGLNFSVLGGSTSTSLTGITNLKLAIPTGVDLKISKVIFRANSKPIGRGQAASTYTWNMPWDTTLYPSGQVYVDAEVYISGQADYCAANGFTSFIGTQASTDLKLFASPEKWEGPMSYGFPVNVRAQTSGSSFDPTPYALYYWQTSIGALASVNNNTAQFSTGKTEGKGTILVRATYGGKSTEVSIPIVVRSLDSPLPEPTTSDDSAVEKTSVESETESENESESEQTISRETTLQNNPVSQNCVISAIGAERYKAINSGEVRPTIEEIQKFKACFASSNYIIPYNFAPVEPNKVGELPKTDRVSVKTPTNSVINSGSEDEKVVLLFSGTAAPNSLVLLYIFSDPLVLTTSANENGEWTYVLEDPIEPGDHEVYTVVDRGNGVYERSDPIAFSIVGTAEAADSNPAGLSLRLSDQTTPEKSRRSLVIYAIGSAATLLVVGLAVLIILRIRRNSNSLANLQISQAQSVELQDNQSASAATPEDHSANDSQNT